MEKEFVPYELALDLKQLGFDEPCLAFYLDNDKKSFTKCMERADTNTWLKEHMKVYGDAITAPLYQQAFRWFRENGKVAEVFSQILPSNKYKWGYKIQGVEGITDGFLTYEEAELACLTKLIEIVEQNKN
jgi:hypothetical protein